MSSQAVSAPKRSVGPLLREWRRRRRRSQLELALDAGVSARHISFLETGRSNPSREMVIGLAAHPALVVDHHWELPTATSRAPSSCRSAAVAAICLAVAALVQLLPGRPTIAPGGAGRSRPKGKFDGKMPRRGAAMR